MNPELCFKLWETIKQFNQARSFNRMRNNHRLSNTRRLVFLRHDGFNTNKSRYSDLFFNWTDRRLIFYCRNTTSDKVDIFRECTVLDDGLLLVERGDRHLAFHIQFFEDVVWDAVEQMVVSDTFQKVFRALHR